LCVKLVTYRKLYRDAWSAKYKNLRPYLLQYMCYVWSAVCVPMQFRCAVYTELGFKCIFVGRTPRNVTWRSAGLYFKWWADTENFAGIFCTTQRTQIEDLLSNFCVCRLIQIWAKFWKNASTEKLNLILPTIAVGSYPDYKKVHTSDITIFWVYTLALL